MRRLLVTGLCCLISAAAAADEAAREHLLQFIRSADGYAANFSQQLLDEQGGEIESAEGKFWLKRPGQFRWHYDPPMERLLVSNGTYIWLYDVDLDQVTKRPAQGELEQTPAGILVGDESSLDNYELTVRTSNGDYVEVGLEPIGSRGDFRDIVIALDNGQIVELRLADRFAQTTVIRFLDVQLNPVIPADQFRLELPDYVDIIDQTQSGE